MHRLYLLIFFLTNLIGCEKASEMDDCIESFIVANDLVRYNGQEIGGKFYYELNKNDEGYFFTIGHHYIDFIAIPQDCDGNNLCLDVSSEDCLQIFEQAHNFGIIAIEK